MESIPTLLGGTPAQQRFSNAAVDDSTGSKNSSIFETGTEAFSFMHVLQQQDPETAEIQETPRAEVSEITTDEEIEPNNIVGVDEMIEATSGKASHPPVDDVPSIETTDGTSNTTPKPEPMMETVSEQTAHLPTRDTSTLETLPMAGSDVTKTGSETSGISNPAAPKSAQETRISALTSPITQGMFSASANALVSVPTVSQVSQFAPPQPKLEKEMGGHGEIGNRRSVEVAFSSAPRSPQREQGLISPQLNAATLSTKSTTPIVPEQHTTPEHVQLRAEVPQAEPTGPASKKSLTIHTAPKFVMTQTTAPAQMSQPTAAVPEAVVNAPEILTSAPAQPSQTNSAPVPQQIVQHTTATHAMPPPRDMVIQLTESNDTLDVTLKPEELGRMTLKLDTSGHGTSVTLFAERSETQELMRRHIEMLHTQLKQMGYSNLSFSFGNNGQHQETSGSEAMSAGLDNASDTQAPEQTTSHTIVLSDTNSGLDIRI